MSLMSARRLAPADIQPKEFSFTAENLAWAKGQIEKYPEGRAASAVLPVLWRAQQQAGGWLPQKAIECVADLLGMPKIRVLEVATFYTMFLLQPVGRKAHVQWCGTTPCLLRGGEEIRKVCERRINHEPFHVSADGDFSWEEVECLGACVNAPMVLIGDDTYEDLTPESFEKVLDALGRGETPKPGPQNGRQFSAPIGGDTTLTDSPISVPHPRESAVAAPPAAAEPTSPAEPAKIQHAPAPMAPSPAADAAVDIAVPAKESEALAAAGEIAEAKELAEAEEAEISAKLANLGKDATPEQKADAVGTRPHGLAAPRADKADNLQRIKGIGRVNEQKLNALGIFHFDQIAGWGRPEIRWVGTYLAFPGRIDRENWVSQATRLASDADNPDKPTKA
jgi:NADH-quinone oxidoreductase subunit E